MPESYTHVARAVALVMGTQRLLAALPVRAQPSVNPGTAETSAGEENAPQVPLDATQPTSVVSQQYLQHPWVSGRLLQRDVRWHSVERLERFHAPFDLLMVLLHHPPVSDESGGPRDNEAALRAQLSSVAAAQPDLRVIGCAADVHSYEHFEAERVVYLVSGGGGAKPTMLQRSAQARYRFDIR